MMQWRARAQGGGAALAGGPGCQALHPSLLAAQPSGGPNRTGAHALTDALTDRPTPRLDPLPPAGPVRQRGRLCLLGRAAVHGGGGAPPRRPHVLPLHPAQHLHSGGALRLHCSIQQVGGLEESGGEGELGGTQGPGASRSQGQGSCSSGSEAQGWDRGLAPCGDEPRVVQGRERGRCCACRRLVQQPFLCALR